ncbi:MAG: hypothetical protein BTN85_0803 [Candidatus Methanohalarchaeum thermophilum]|uniref:Uncharacterized protein n=1 Tax=Methanohalarchaeum thermophilum TaxID=1903181 RepID=A0A1Q6DVD1_METT1|nr:MAG: hypothetical protein BTN85_0803 [Candidatus Methanohalarchaeum thermophilum]
MSLKREKKIPLPNNPYKIYKEENFHKVPFPKYIAQILGEDPEGLKENYEVRISVDRGKKVVELDLVDKS